MNIIEIEKSIIAHPGKHKRRVINLDRGAIRWGRERSKIERVDGYIHWGKGGELHRYERGEGRFTETGDGSDLEKKGCICTPQMNSGPGCTFLGPYLGGCNRCKCEINAQLVEIFIENRLWSRGEENARFFWGLGLLVILWGVAPGSPLRDGALRPQSLLPRSVQIAPQGRLLQLHPQDKILATALGGEIHLRVGRADKLREAGGGKHTWELGG